mmetsp:Transcript_51770/g.168268  ORF Transcript_51770/g.168268 Transcript_51770/m.168268 type:complete len:231 (+) Transcript_51770:1632-2324(+)
MAMAIVGPASASLSGLKFWASHGCTLPSCSSFAWAPSSASAPSEATSSKPPPFTSVTLLAALRITLSRFSSSESASTRTRRRSWLVPAVSMYFSTSLLSLPASATSSSTVSEVTTRRLLLGRRLGPRSLPKPFASVPHQAMSSVAAPPPPPPPPPPRLPLSPVAAAAGAAEAGCGEPSASSPPNACSSPSPGTSSALAASAASSKPSENVAAPRSLGMPRPLLLKEASTV